MAGETTSKGVRRAQVVKFDCLKGAIPKYHQGNLVYVNGRLRHVETFSLIDDGWIYSFTGMGVFSEREIKPYAVSNSSSR